MTPLQKERAVVTKRHLRQKKTVKQICRTISKSEIVSDCYVLCPKCVFETKCMITNLAQENHMVEILCMTSLLYCEIQ